MGNCYPLCLNFNPVNDKFLFHSPDVPKFSMSSCSFEDLSNECKNWIKDIDLEFNHAFIFFQPGIKTGNGIYNKNSIHIDGVLPNAREFGINWNFNTENFEMRWYKTKEGEIGTYKYFPNYSITSFKDDQMDIIETSSSLNPVLFRTSVPHSVMNFSDKPRYSISLAFKTKLKWDEIVKHLDRYIIH